jgi:hypothetical protein
MINSIINRIQHLTFSNYKSIEDLAEVSNAAIAFLMDSLNRPYPTAEMVECIAEIDSCLKRNFSQLSLSEKHNTVKTEILQSLYKLKLTYYLNPNNISYSTTGYLDKENTLTADNELQLDFLMLEQRHIEYFRELPAKCQFEKHGRLNEHYIGLGNEYFVLKESQIPESIKFEFDDVFKKWKSTFLVNQL